MSTLPFNVNPGMLDQYKQATQQSQAAVASPPPPASPVSPVQPVQPRRFPGRAAGAGKKFGKIGKR